MFLTSPTFIEYDTIDSTQDEAKRLIEKNANLHNHILLAVKQTAGRGRYGRTWESLEGNLALSFVIDPDIVFFHSLSKSKWSQLSFIMALAVENALSSYMKDHVSALAFKWPNDILLYERKLAGILLEFVSTPEGKSFIIIGVGLNHVASPKNTPFPATCLKAYDLYIPLLKDYVKMMVEKFWYFIAHYKKEGFSIIRNSWLKKAYFPSTLVTMQSTKKNYTGYIQGLSEEGGLVLRLENTNEEYIVDSGEIYYS